MFTVKSNVSTTDTFGTHTTCPSERESNQGIQEWHGPVLGVCFTRCPSYRELNKGSQERQGPTLGVRLIESQIKGVKKWRDQL